MATSARTSRPFESGPDDGEYLLTISFRRSGQRHRFTPAEARAQDCGIIPGRGASSPWVLPYRGQPENACKASHRNGVSLDSALRPYAASNEALQGSSKPLERYSSKDQRTAAAPAAAIRGRSTGQALRAARPGRVVAREEDRFDFDHANGVRDDNRIENLRIVCPNCAATLIRIAAERTEFRLRHWSAGAAACTTLEWWAEVLLSVLR